MKILNILVILFVVNITEIANAGQAGWSKCDSMFDEIVEKHQSKNYFNYKDRRLLLNKATDEILQKFGGYDESLQKLRMKTKNNESIQLEIHKYGDVLLGNAIMRNDLEALEFYINNGVDLIEPSSKLGSLILLAVRIHRRESYEFMKEKLITNPDANDILYDIDKYYECTSPKQKRH